MATRAKSINDITAQRMRILSLINEARNRTGAATSRRTSELNRRMRTANSAATRYVRNIASTHTYDADGGNDFVQKSTSTSRKYKNYQTEGKASATT